MNIENRETLLVGEESALRADAIGIVEAALSAVEPDRLLEGRVERSDGTVRIDDRTYDLETAGEIFIIGAGKGAGALTAAVLDRLGGNVSESTVVEKDASTIDPGELRTVDGLTVLEAGHPIPTRASREAADRVLELADRAGPDDLVICCVTGGASALLAAPDGVDPEAMAETTDALLRAGAPIEEINAVRKHLSKIKGGRLAERFAPAETVALIVVDEVAGEPWGPTAPDSTTYADALDVLNRHGLTESLSVAVVDRLQRGADGEYPETLDHDAIGELPVENVVLADASAVCRPAAEAARERGYDPLFLSARLEGEASEVGLVHAGIATDVVEAERPVAPPMALVTGGETTVTVAEEPGDGGPNQETALGFAVGIDGWDGIVGAFVGTDGTDGPTDLAGAIATGQTRRRAKAAGVPIGAALDRNDAARTVTELGDAIVTGATETNLMDLRVVLVGESGARPGRSDEG